MKKRVTSLNFASVVATFTPTSNPTLQPIVFRSDVFWNEEQMLSEPSPALPRAKYFASNDGSTGQYIDIFAVAGSRDIMIIEGDESELIQRWSLSNPQPLFNLSFFYKRNDADDSKARTQNHIGCKFLNHPIRAIDNNIISVKFNFNYAKLEVLDENGRPLII